MGENSLIPSNGNSEINPEDLKRQLDEALSRGQGPRIARFALACLSGVPFVGGAIGGAGAWWSEHDQKKMNEILAAWLKLQEEEIREIGITLAEMLVRVDTDDQEVRKRLESPEYLSLVKKCFRDWSAAESEGKRQLLRNLLTHAVIAKLCSDDVVRLFIEWIASYSELHFKVIQVVYQHPESTREEIWEKVYGERVREDSPEADMFKLLIRDLSTGQIIRQHRETDHSGNFLRQRRPRLSGGAFTSAFDDSKPYELTQLGKQFVHYTMQEVVPKLSAGSGVGPSKT